MCSGDKTPTTSQSDAGTGTPGGTETPCPCADARITSETVATSPANRARTKVGVGEEVTLTYSLGSATWTITSGSGTLSPTSGSQTTFTADDNAGNVTISATGSGCTCTITLTVVQPSSVSMERKAGTNLEHTQGRPDCGWRGKQWIHPDDVNFYRIERREVDSQAVCTGSYTPFNGVYHGNYAGGFGPWSGVNVHDPAKGSQAAMTDRIYSGYTGAEATGAAPPFTVGTMYFPIVYQWRVIGNATIHSFPAIRQEHEIFSDGKCESRKGGNTEFCMHNDPTSTP